MEIKDYGPIDADLGGVHDKPARHYPPHAYSRSNSGISLKHTNITSDKTKISASKSNIAAPSTGVSGIPSPRGKPPAPPLRRSSDVSSCQPESDPNTVTSVNNSVSEDKTDPPVSLVSEASVTSSYLSRTCSLPRQKRDPLPSSPANVAVVSPMPHMTKSRSVSETGAVKKSGDTQENGEDSLNGE